MVARSQTSAAGVLALLSEPEPVFKQHALKALSPLVPQFWAEISEHIALMSVHILVLNQFPDSPFIPEKLCMRATTSPRMLEIQLRFWQARSIIFWASTTKHSLLLLGPETRLKPKVALMGQRNMLKLLFVSGIQ